MADTVEVTVTYLEMTARPDYPRPPAPSQPQIALIRAEDPPVRWFLHLYRSVGAPYHWTDWLTKERSDLDSFVTAPEVEIFTLMVSGWSGGFFMLDGREAGVTELAYFGLAPEVVGKGLGGFLLKTAIHTAWDRPDTERVTVNTCTLDHQAALPLYQKHGFQPIRRETYQRDMSQGMDAF